MRRLLPDPGRPRSSEQLDSYRPWEQPHEERPFVAMNFAATVDGRATIDGVSGPIGSDTDTAMLAGLRTRFDAVMIGAGTMRAERYGEHRAGGSSWSRAGQEGGWTSAAAPALTARGRRQGAALRGRADACTARYRRRAWSTSSS